MFNIYKIKSVQRYRKKKKTRYPNTANKMVAKNMREKRCFNPKQIIIMEESITAICFFRIRMLKSFWNFSCDFPVVLFLFVLRFAPIHQYSLLFACISNITPILLFIYHVRSLFPSAYSNFCVTRVYHFYRHMKRNNALKNDADFPICVHIKSANANDIITIKIKEET